MHAYLLRSALALFRPGKTLARRPDPNPPSPLPFLWAAERARVLKISPISADSFPVGEFGAALRCAAGERAGRKSRKEKRKARGSTTYAEEEAAARDVCESRSAGRRNPSPLGGKFHCRNVVM